MQRTARLTSFKVILPNLPTDNRFHYKYATGIKGETRTRNGNPQGWNGEIPDGNYISKEGG
jgi:hypothetical protein